MSLCRSYQVRGHLAAQIDPLGLNNMDSEKARNMIIRSVKVDEKDLDKEFQLPQTTWIGGDQKTLPLREIIKRMENVYPTLWCCPSCTAPVARSVDGRGLGKGDRDRRSESNAERETECGGSVTFEQQ